MNELHEITVELAKHTIEIESLNQTVEVVLPVQTQVITRVEAVVIENGQSELINDLTPQLGGDLDLNSKQILGEVSSNQFVVDGGLLG